MLKLIDKALDHLPGSAVVYLVAFAVGLTAAAGEIAQAAPEGGETAAGWLVRVAAGASAAAEIYRRVTEVPEAARGLTLPEGVGLQVSVQNGGSTEIRSEG